MHVSPRCHSGAVTWQPTCEKGPGVQTGLSWDRSPWQQAAEGRAGQDREGSEQWPKSCCSLSFEQPAQHKGNQVSAAETVLQTFSPSGDMQAFGCAGKMLGYAGEIPGYSRKRHGFSRDRFWCQGRCLLALSKTVRCSRKMLDS